MVAILKLIISAALLSQASAAAIEKRVTVTASSGVLQADDPVLAIDPAKITTATVATTTKSSTPQLKAAVAISSSSSLVAVPTNIVIGKLIVGDPVLAVRPTAAAAKVTSKISVQTTMATSIIKAVPTSLSL